MPNTKGSKIIFDGSPLRYLHTGLGQFSYYLIKELAQHHEKYDLSFLVHQASKGLIDAFTQRLVEVTWLRRHAPHFLLPALFKKYDLWHASSEITRFNNFPDSARVLVTLHGLHFLDEDAPDLAKRKLDQVQKLVNKSHALATVSAYTETIVRKNLDLGNRPLKIIHHGVEDKTAQEYKKPGMVTNAKFIFSIGSFFERKNFHVLLPFLQRLDGYKLILAGDHRKGYGKFIKKEILKLSLSDRVILTGEIGEPEKNWLYQNCEAFVFPSISEGFGIPVIEALQAGKPVFCSEFGSLPEMGGVHAFYWKNFEPDYMRDFFIEKIHTFNQNPENKINCRRYASSFSWRKAAESYLSYYAELLN